MPASIIFGALWDARGSRVRVDFGAALAMTAAIGIVTISIREPSAT